MIRKYVFKWSIIIILVLSFVFSAIIYLTGNANLFLKGQSVMITVAVTLAGFLFTGQGIILTLPPENKFLKLVKKYGYLADFHRLCRWAEILFVASIFLSVQVLSCMPINILYIFCYCAALISALWAVCLFSVLVKYYTESDT